MCEHDENRQELSCWRCQEDTSPLLEHLPDELREADEGAIQWDELARQIGKTGESYHLPVAFESEFGPRIDKLRLCQDAAQYISDGGEVDMQEVLTDG